MSSPWSGRRCKEGSPGRTAAALGGLLSLLHSRSLQGKHAADGTLWREGLGGLEQAFFFSLWKVAEQILDNHFILLGSDV